MQCPICENDEKNQEFIVKEMQIGLREEFTYVECSKCGCLFIKDIPDNLSKYYDESYAPHLANNFKNNIIDKVLCKLYANNPIIKSIFINKVSPFSKFMNNLVSNKIITKESSILDVGCGNGRLLNTLKNAGFNNLTGIDLFVEKGNILDGISIFNTSLENFHPPEKYDFVMSNHSFEHMDNQLMNLKCFEKLIKDNGTIMIHIPVKSEYFWDTYGVNWYQIDAPRHLFLHTIDSFKILCDKTNLVIENIVFDSHRDAFINCEKYANNISMRDEDWSKFKLNHEKTKEYKKLIDSLNESNNADQAIFILKLNGSK